MTFERFARGWVVLSAVVFALMLLHRSTPALILDRYSSSYVLLLLAVLAAAAAAWGVSLPRLRTAVTRLTLTHRPRWLQWLWLASVAMVLVLYWLYAPITSVNEGPQLFRVYGALTLLAWGLLPLAQSAPLPDFKGDGKTLAVVTVLLLALLLLLERVPPASYYDEGFVASWAVTWARTGDGSLISMSNNYIAPYVYAGLLPIGMFADTFGVTMFNARLGSVLLGALGLPFLFGVTRRWFGTSLAWVAVLVAGAFAIENGYVRADSLSAASLAFALWAIAKADAARQARWYALAGLALAFTIEGHHLALRFAPAVAGWLLLQAVRRDSRAFALRSLGALTVGGASYTLIYLLTRLLSSGLSLSDYLTVVSASYETQVNYGGGFTFVERVIRGPLTGFTYLLIVHPVIGIGVVVGSVAALLTRRRELCFLVFLFYVSSVFYFLLNPKVYHVFYVVHLLPLAVLLTIGTLAVLPVRVRGGASLLVLVLCVAQLLHVARVNSPATPLIALSQSLHAHLPAQAQRIVGAEAYYWGLNEREFYAVYQVLERLDNAVPNPDVVIVTMGLDSVPNLYAYIAQEGLTRQACVDLPVFGRRADIYSRMALSLPFDTGCPPEN